MIFKTLYLPDGRFVHVNLYLLENVYGREFIRIWPESKKLALKQHLWNKKHPKLARVLQNVFGSENRSRMCEPAVIGFKMSGSKYPKEFAMRSNDAMYEALDALQKQLDPYFFVGGTSR